MVNHYSKQRLIFSLYFKDGEYCLSRNYSLQKVGGIEWLLEKFQIGEVGNSIDELVILNVSTPDSTVTLEEHLQKLLPNFFVPVSVGGMVRSEDQVRNLFDLGADRIVFNSAILKEEALPSWTISRYGSNAVVASLDFKRSDNQDRFELFSKRHPEVASYPIDRALKTIADLGIREIIVGSVDHDGTGYGVDLELHDFLLGRTKTKLIPSGGIDTEDQIRQAFELCQPEAIIASHLFNFMGPQLKKTRSALLDAGVNLATWSR
jgi:cyclase